MLRSYTRLIEIFKKRKKRVEDFKKLINRYKISYILLSEESMKRLFITSILFLISFGAFADERQRKIEYEAINLVIRKYGKGLENKIK